MRRITSDGFLVFRTWRPSLALGLLASLAVLLCMSPARAAGTVGPFVAATPPAPSGYARLYVDNTNPNAVDTGGCADPTHPCKTIGGALNVPLPSGLGQDVTVASGLYCEHLNISHDPGNQPVEIDGGYDSGFSTQSGTTLVDGEGFGSPCSGTLSPNPVFIITAPAVLQNLTIQDGGHNDTGGGIFNGSTLTLNNVDVRANTAINNGNGGGIYNGGTLTVTNSFIHGNSPASGSINGGGLYNSGTATLTNVSLANNEATGFFGGAIANASGATLTLTNITISGNVAGSGGGINNNGGTVTMSNVFFNSNRASFAGGGGGGAIVNGGTLSGTDVVFNNNSAGAGAGGVLSGSSLTLTNSTFAGNQALGGSGGAVSLGGTATLTNVTFSGNSATGGNGGAVDNFGTATTLTNVTISGNSANSGGGVWNESGGTLTLQGSIVANSTHGDCLNNGTLTSKGGNVADDNSCNLTGPADLANTNPQLGLLANNGGPSVGYGPGGVVLMQTLALLSGSPAIDHVPSSLCPPPSTDERGTTRPQGAACDSGAFESSGTPSPTATPSATPSATPTPPPATTPTPLPGGPTVTYQPGWNLVGGPAGTIMTGALGPLYTFQAADSNYETSTSNVVTGLEGFWAYFSAPTTITLPSVSGSSTSLTLPANHYIMAGNPFVRPATLSAPGATIYTYSPAGGYALATGSATLQPGQGAWVFSPTGGTLTITST